MILSAKKFKAKYGSKKGLVKFYAFLLLHSLGFKFGTSKMSREEVGRLVFVCKGNICRSAYAEAYAKPRSKIPCLSLGLDTTQGKPANDRVIRLCTTRGISLERHRTTELTNFEAHAKDVFVCMEPSQSIQLRSFLPEANIVLLGLQGRPKVPYIHDPYSSNDDYLYNCLKLIENKVEDLLVNLEMTKSDYLK